MISVSLVSAAYNECPEIINLINNWINYLDNHKQIKNFEVIICDDFSELRQFNLLKESFAKNSNINILRNNQNEGPGYSFSRAISIAKYEWTLIIDSDGQFPIENLNELINTINVHDIDVIFTFRDIKFDNYFNKFGKNISNYLCNYIYKTNLKDFTCAFKFIKTNLIRNLRFDARYMNYSLDHTSKLLNLNVSFKELLIYCNPGKIKKRNIFNELKRAKYRFYYIFYLFINRKLKNDRIIF